MNPDLGPPPQDNLIAAVQADAQEARQGDLADEEREPGANIPALDMLPAILQVGENSGGQQIAPVPANVGGIRHNFPNENEWVPNGQDIARMPQHILDVVRP